ncbi:MAG: ATP-binding cassette domain-containing protein [Acidobacteriia bacterium]|nr:ATP-binding cassette domain-containing protein [Terriglobia bacterium]
MSFGALAVQNLTIQLTPERNAAIPIVSGVTFQMEPGAMVGLFGESGCGKTTLALALLKLLPASRYRVSGSSAWGSARFFPSRSRNWSASAGRRSPWSFKIPCWR